MNLEDLPTKPHHNICVDNFPTSWGYLPQDAATNTFINNAIVCVLSHYLVDGDLKKIWESIKVLEDTYDDCEIYSSETINAICDQMETFHNHEDYEISEGFRTHFWGE